MNSCAYGTIDKYYPKERVISLVLDGKTSYFFHARSMSKYFIEAMKGESVYVFFDYSNNKPKKLLFTEDEANQITCVHKIKSVIDSKEITIYSFLDKTNPIINELNDIKYKLFIDFEFTMPDYSKDPKGFTPEIIQVGMVLTDEYDKIINEFSSYIKTKNEISDRTLKFLKLFKEDLLDSIEYHEFYDILKRYLKIYNPTLFVWGSSDVPCLNNSFILNSKEPLIYKSIDLEKVVKQFYKLDEDMGLFKALKFFADVKITQAHHALTDAAATKEVFYHFKKKFNTDFDLKEEYIKNKEKKGID